MSKNGEKSSFHGLPGQLIFSRYIAYPYFSLLRAQFSSVEQTSHDNVVGDDDNDDDNNDNDMSFHVLSTYYYMCQELCIHLL